MHLDCGFGHNSAHFCHVRFGMAGHEARLLRHKVVGMSGIPDQRARRLQLCNHIGTHVFDGLKRADGAIKLLPFASVGHRLFNHHLSGTKHIRRQSNAPTIKHSGDSSTSATSGTNEFGIDIVEDNLGNASGFINRWQCPERHTASISLNQHQRIFTHRHQNHIGHTGIKDKQRFAV